MQYLLDTNAIISLLDDPAGAVSRRVRQYAPNDFVLSAIVLHELYFGAYKSERREPNVARVDGLLFEVVEFDKEDARHAGEIRATLALRGLPIGAFDVLIAGQARARGLTLITRNVREFRRVDGLRFENWQPE